MSSTGSAKYNLGDQVQIRIDSPPGHIRTPLYIQGKRGQVGAICGVFPNPESLAHGGSGLPKQTLYRVEFDQDQVWENYPGPSHDKILVDVYEHWLNPV